MADIEPTPPVKASSTRRIIMLAGILLAILAIFFFVERSANANEKTHSFTTSIR